MADETLTYAMKFDIGDATASLANAQQRVAELHQTWEGLSDAERAAIEDFTAAKDALKLQAEAAGLSVGEFTRLRAALESAAQAEQAQAAATQAATQAAAAAAEAAAQRTAELSAAYDSLSSAERDAIAEMQRAKDALQLQAEAAGISVGELSRLRSSLEGAAEAERRIAQAAQEAAAAQQQAVQAAVAAENERMAAATKRAAALKGVSAEEVTAAKAIRDQRDELKAHADVLGISTVELGKMRGATTGVTKSTKNMGREMHSSGRSMADINNRAKILRAQFADIGTTLVGGMNPFMVLAQQGPDVAHALGDASTAAGVLTKTFGRLMAITGPLSIVFSGIALAYTIYTIETAKANETSDAMTRSLERLQGEAEKTAKALDRAKGSWESFSGLRTNLEQRLDVLSGMRSQTEVDRGNLTAQIEAETMPTIKALGQQVAQTEAQLAIKREQLKEVTSLSQAKTLESEIANLQMLSRHTEKRLQQAQEQRQEALYLVDAVADAEAAEEARTEAAKETTKAYKSQTKEMQKQNEAAEQIRINQIAAATSRKRSAQMGGTLGIQDLGALRAEETAGFARTVQETGIDISTFEEMFKAAETAEEFEQLIEYMGWFAEEVAKSTEAIKDETEEREDAAKKAQEAAATRRQSQKDAALGMLSTGDPTALIASAGPQGAIIAEVTKMLKAFGDAESGATPIDMLDEFIGSVTKGLEVLPTALAEALPDILTKSIPALVIGLADGMVSLVDTAIPAILGSLDELIEVLIKEVGPALLTFKGDIAAAVVTSVVPALLDALKAIGTLLMDPQFWQETGTNIRERVGTMMGNAFKGGKDLRERVGEALGILGRMTVDIIGSSLRKVFTVNFWLDILKTLVKAVQNFSLSDVSTPGLDAFRTASGREEGTRSGIGSRARGVAAGARTRIQNISVSGAVGDPRSLRRFLRNASLRRDGVGSIG